MIKATELNYEFVKQFNRINSSYNKSIPVVARDSYLNHAIDTVLENYSAIAEINSTVRNHLRQLEEKRISLEIIKTDDDYCIVKYPKNFYRFLRINAIMKTESCSKSKEVIVRTVQTNDLSETLKDPYWEPSFEWEETVGEEGAKGYYIYKKPEHTVTKVIVDYIRKINKIAAPSLSDTGSYVTSSGELVKVDSNFEIDSTFIWRKVVDVAVLYALRDVGQVDDFSAKMQEILFIDKLYLK